MIGNRENAALALTRPKNLLLDEGTTRTAFLIDGVVYKVDDDHGANELEIANYYKWRDRLPQGISFPEMQLYRVNGRYVIAAEYVDGEDTGDCVDEACGLPCTCESPCLSAATLDTIAWWTDCAWGNAKWYDGVLYLIDICY